MNTADGSGVLGRLDYAVNNGLTVGTSLSYDSAFKSRFSADIKWRFDTNGGPNKGQTKTNAATESLISTPGNRDVRVHDGFEKCPKDLVENAVGGTVAGGTAGLKGGLRGMGVGAILGYAGGVYKSLATCWWK